MKTFNPVSNATLENNGKLIKTVVYEIGGWDMVTIAVKNVNHSIDISKVVNLSVVLFNDGRDELYHIHIVGPTWHATAYIAMYPTEFELEREPGGFFDSPDWNNNGINRGYIMVQYFE